MESIVPLFFEHNMRFYVIPLRYVFKLIGSSPKAGPKMCLFFEFLKSFNKQLIFLSVFITLIKILDLTISIISFVLKKGVFRRVKVVYFKQLTWQNRHRVHRS